MVEFAMALVTIVVVVVVVVIVVVAVVVVNFLASAAFWASLAAFRLGLAPVIKYNHIRY